MESSGIAAGVGILRNSGGISQIAFAANYGICMITCAELRAALYEFRLAWDLG
ncbi:hypothetical protein LINGRAHAP2_LOCUS7622 [Linum grandiflorum]